MTAKASEKQGPITRREFIAKTAAGAVALSAIPGFYTAHGQVQGANGKLGVGFIGCGGRSGGHMSMVKQLRDEQYPVELVACCDVYKPRMEQKKKDFGMAKGFMDYRELLADPAVDVVCIATPDHWHAYHAIDAVKAGKHVYCEKPVSHWSQFKITRELADLVEKSNCSFVCGAQAMSDSAWHQMKKHVKEGLIGKPLYAETGYFRTGDFGERGMHIDDPNAKPGPDLNWDAFLGPDRPKRAYSVDRHFRWRLFEDYAGGPLTDLYPHSLTPVMDILGVGMPDAVSGMGGIFCYPYELREVPDTFSAIAQFPEKVVINIMGTQGNDYQTTTQRGAGFRSPVIRGTDGTLTIDKNNKEIVFTPVRIVGAKKPQTFPIEHAENNTELWRNLLECARTKNRQTWSPMDLAFRVQTVLQMAMLSHRSGKTAKFDKAQREIII